MLIKNALLDDALVDLICDTHIRRLVPAGSENVMDSDVVDVRGAQVLPGLHDHHFHFLATVAAASSIDFSTSGNERPARSNPARRMREMGDREASHNVRNSSAVSLFSRTSFFRPDANFRGMILPCRNRHTLSSVTAMPTIEKTAKTK